MSMLPSFHSTFGPDSTITVPSSLPATADTGSSSVGDPAHSGARKRIDDSTVAQPNSGTSSSPGPNCSAPAPGEESTNGPSTATSSGSGAAAPTGPSEDSVATNVAIGVNSGSTGSGTSRPPTALDPLPFDKFGLSLDGSAYICTGSSKRARTRSGHSATYRAHSGASESLLRNGSVSGAASSFFSQSRTIAARLGVLEDSTVPRDVEASLFAPPTNPIDTHHSFQSSVMARPVPPPGATAIFPGPSKSDFSGLWSTYEPAGNAFDSGAAEEHNHVNVDTILPPRSPGRPVGPSVDFLPVTSAPPPVTVTLAASVPSPSVPPALTSSADEELQNQVESQQLSQRLAEQQIKSGSSSGSGVSSGRVEKRPHSPRRVKCVVCSAVLRTRANLHNHMRVVHKSSSVHRCSECGAEFPWKSTLQNHIRLVHLKERPFNCGSCNKAFRWSSHLEEHIWVTHEKRKPFKCEICGKDFGRKNNMQKHMRKVHDDQAGRSAAKGPPRVGADQGHGNGRFGNSFLTQ